MTPASIPNQQTSVHWVTESRSELSVLSVNEQLSDTRRPIDLGLIKPLGFD